MTERFTVYLVDDDPGVLKALSRLLRAKDYNVKPYSSPRVFLEEHARTLIARERHDRRPHRASENDGMTRIACTVRAADT